MLLSSSLKYGKIMNKYQAKIIDVIDGDTYIALVELGFGVVQKFHIRLFGVDAPEKKTDSGKEVLLKVRQLILNKDVILTDVEKHEKYGRALANIELPCMNIDLANYLTENGLAVAYDGKAKFSIISL